MKEKLIGEFKNYLASSIIDKDELVKLFTKAIDQTREETIRGIIFPSRDEIVEDPLGCLDKLEQSLIKLRQK